MKKLLAILITILILTGCSVSFNNSFTGNNTLKIIASDTYETMNLEEFISDGTSVGVHIDYMPDIDIVSTLNSNPKVYDAILISNSMWTYMLNNVYLTESKSLAISPVVFAIKESKAKELDLIGKDITNKDIIDLIKDGKITYTMPSAVRTNVGATSYLGFINVLSGNPQVLSSSHLSSTFLKNDLATLFKNVERNSGSELYTFDILKQNNYDALVATEAAIINYNLENPNNALYMLYPSDGVPITDSMFTFIGNADKKDTFIKVRDYLLSDAGKEIFNDNNFRTWYGGTSENPGSNFKKEWGIDTSKVLKITSFPSKEVMNEAFSLYIDSFRKPAAVTFVLDYSGSMEGKGIEQLDEAVSYIFNNETSATEYLQFSDSDLVNIIYFFYGDLYQIQTVKGSEVSSALEELKSLYAAGGTPLYEATLSAISTEKDLMDQYGDAYNYSVILMTDGEPTGINFSEFEYYWKNYDFDKVNIPTYTIAFGNAIVSELERLAKLTGGKAFDGRLDLMGAFKEIRGYN